MKKIYFMMMLVLAGTMAIAQTSVWHGGRTVWTRGMGTESDPYLIESAENLAFLSYAVNKGYDTEDLYFRLTTDIDLNGSEDQQWVPIGLGDRWFNEDGCDRGTQGGGYSFSPRTYFRGHFDGGEHSISNIYIDNSDGAFGITAGLFGTVAGKSDGSEVYPAVIENVFVTSGYIKGSSCGGIVGNGSRTTLVSRCWNGADIEAIGSGSQQSTGGIVGCQPYQIKNCYNKGEIRGYAAGGIVGSGGAEIEECYNEGDITGAFAGGIYGYALMARVAITSCYNMGSITANTDYGQVPGSSPAGPAAGGIASFIFRSNGSITNCYNVGAVSSTQDAGCILAYGPEVTFENNYYINTCDAGDEGEPLTEEFMHSQEFVDFLNSLGTGQTWVLDENNTNGGFPVLASIDLAVNELSEPGFQVYPNPAQGQFTVEGMGRMTVCNVLGQTVLIREIDGQATVELPRGLYFVKMNGATRKIVVE